MLDFMVIGFEMLQKTLHEIANQIKLTNYLDYKKYLLDIYKKLKEIEPNYSYIKYSEDLGFGHCNAMNLIVLGKRPLTLKSGKKITTALNITNVERLYFLKLIEFSKCYQSDEREKLFSELSQFKSRALPTELDKKQLEFYLNWYNAAILEILSIESSKDCPKWISQKLHPRVTEAKVKKSIDLLLTLEMIHFDKSKQRYFPTKENFSTDDEVIGMAIIGYHQEMIELGKQSLTVEKATERDISSVTIAFTKSQINILKKEISEFRKKILELSSEQVSEDIIYQMNVQLFPIAKELDEEQES